MGDFFKPPPSPATGQAEGGAAPPWTGRPHGPPPGEVLGEVVLFESETVTLSIAYLDAYPDGFELEIHARTTIAWNDLARPVDSGPDVFGRHWPMVGEPSDVLPQQLVRVGVEFADGRRATNIGGHDRPAGGPIVWPLRGGGSGGATGSRFQQGYWISPLPPPGSVSIVGEWPVAGVPVVRHVVDAQRFHDAGERSRTLVATDQRVTRDGQAWRLCADSDVTWINTGTPPGRAITAAIPPIFAAYCTLTMPFDDDDALPVYEQALIELLAEQTPDQPWRLGYLDTGASEVVFPYAPRTTVYWYGYVLVEAGPQQATSWRTPDFRGGLPDLMFPRDRSWLVSTMWDDQWTSVGATESIVNRILQHPLLAPIARQVTVKADATPPGHQAI